MASPESLFAAVLTAQPARPLVTHYDETTGTRSEVSARSLANWVAKTHFLVRDALGLGVGESAYVDLPAHWISAAILIGCWSAGLDVRSSADGADVAFVEAVAAADVTGVPDAFVVDPGAAVSGRTGEPVGSAQDYTAAIRPQPDAWAGVQFPAGDADAAVDGRSRADVTAEAAAAATAAGWAHGARVITDRTWRSPADWIGLLLAPLTVTGSVVYLRIAAPDAELVARRRQQERATDVC